MNSTVHNTKRDVQIVRIEKSLAEFVLQWILQVIAVVSAVIFGTFSILAWKDAEIAKRQANLANSISLGTLCLSLPVSVVHDNFI